MRVHLVLVCVCVFTCVSARECVCVCMCVCVCTEGVSMLDETVVVTVTASSVSALGRMSEDKQRLTLLSVSAPHLP